MQGILAPKQPAACSRRANARHSTHLLKASSIHPASYVESSHQSRQCSTIALKEWNVAIGALREGLQTILLRKGGIREPLFKPPGKEFLLFPTSFHSEENLLKPGIADRFQQELALEPRKEASLQLPVYVSVTGAWVTEDLEVLSALSDLHIWTPALGPLDLHDSIYNRHRLTNLLFQAMQNCCAKPFHMQAFVDARLKWRGKQPLTLLELRAWKLQPPATLQVKEEFFGCFSFVDVASGLQQPLTLHDAQPAIPEAEFQVRQKVLRERLASIQCNELQL